MKNQYSALSTIITLAGVAAFFFLMPSAPGVSMLGFFTAMVGACAGTHHNDIDYREGAWSWFKKK